MNKKININNYEEFLIDFLDGNLDEEDKISVVDFLNRNPKIKAEFDLVQDFKLPETTEKLDIKEDLYKSDKCNQITESNYQNYFIAFVNDELSESEKTKLDIFIKTNPELKKEFDLFSKTKLKSDNKIIYPNKESLKIIAVNEYKYINQENYSNYIIAYLEGDLSEDELIDYKQFVKLNPQLKKEISLFQNTVLKADKSIVFEDKNKLKSITDRKLFSSIPFSAYFSVASAAILIFVISIVFKLHNFSNLPNPSPTYQYQSINYFGNDNMSLKALSSINVSKIFQENSEMKYHIEMNSPKKTNHIIADEDSNIEHFEISKIQLKHPESYDMNSIEIKAERIECSLNKKSLEPKVIYAENSKSSEYLERPGVKNVTGKINDVLNSSEEIRDIASGDFDKNDILKFGVKQFNKLFDKK